MATSMNMCSCLKSGRWLCKFFKTHVRWLNAADVRYRSTVVGPAAVQLDGESKKSSRSLRHGKWESVVGLEIHAQISADSKLFSGSGTSFRAAVNTQVSLFDAAFPGTLPVLNRRCVEAAVLTSLALGCQINTVSEFDRKHYFYADLPAGYQITQQRKPIAQNGSFAFAVIPVPEPYIHEAKIKQIQLEQDSGKSLHDPTNSVSLVDLNRAGVGLMEIVFDANLSSGYEAHGLVEELRYLLAFLGTCSGKMGEGSLRVDANVSVNEVGQPWGVRTELKNLNSLKSVARAVEYEIDRQISVCEKGGVIENETRTYNAKSRETIPMRDKEVKQDYRFMPEPNLPPLQLDTTVSTTSRTVCIEEVAKRLPAVFPAQQRLQLMQTYNLSVADATFYTFNPDALRVFEGMVNFAKDVHAQRIVTFLRNEIYPCLNDRKLSYNTCPISPDKLMKVLMAFDQLGPKQRQELLKILFDGDERSPEEIVAANKWAALCDPVKIEQICKTVIEKHPNLVNNYKGGKERAFRRLLGIAKTYHEGELNIELVTETFHRLLEK